MTEHPPSSQSPTLLWRIKSLLMSTREGHYQFDPPADDPAPTQLLGEPKHYGLDGFNHRDLRLATGEQVTAWYKPPQKGFPTIAYCHGNAGTLARRSVELQEMGSRGFGTIIAAYPGFKGHKPRIPYEPSEQACNHTAYAMVRELLIRHKTPVNKIVLFGESLGGAVAIHTAYALEQGKAGSQLPEPMHIGAVICQNTFSSMAERAREKYPHLWTEVLNNRFDSRAIIGDVKTPTLLMYGTEDTYTPPHHSQRLQEAGKRDAEGNYTVRLQALPGFNHTGTKDGSTEKDPEKIKQMVDCVQDFLTELKLCPPPAQHPRIRPAEASLRR